MHDHRELGRELGLFDTDPLIGAGLPYWLPAGAAVRHALEEYLREQSGVLGGLTRVRAMQLNDAHIFCAPDQAAAEAGAALAMIRQAYAALGIEPARYRLSLAGPASPGSSSKYAGDPRIWDQAAAMLAGILDDSGLPWEAGEGEAAFYGPKIDVQVADAAEREATLSTVQVDFYQPAQFGLHSTGADGARPRP